MRDSIRLTFRMHRFEVLAIATATLLLVLAAYVVAARLEAVGFGPCAGAQGPWSPRCESLAKVFFGIAQSEGTAVLGLIAVLPYAAGLILGGPLIAREIERGTTRLAWSISPSRLRWYLARMLPIVAVVFALMFAAGSAADHLFAAQEPRLDTANAFDLYGVRGSLIALEALVMTAGAIGLGAVTGRVLPTLILALILGAVGVTGVATLHARYTATEAILVDGEFVDSGARWVDQFFRLPDGRLVSWNELEEIDPGILTSETGPDYPIVSKVIPGERYREVEAREMIILGAIAFMMLAGTAVIIQRRRPG